MCQFDLNSQNVRWILTIMATKKNKKNKKYTKKRYKTTKNPVQKNMFFMSLPGWANCCIRPTSICCAARDGFLKLYSKPNSLWKAFYVVIPRANEDVGNIKYVSLDGMGELWWKIMHIWCLALKTHSRSRCGPPRKKIAHLCSRFSVGGSLCHASCV